MTYESLVDANGIQMHCPIMYIVFRSEHIGR